MNNVFLANIFTTNWVYYVACVILVLLVMFGIYLMSDVKKAVMGNRISAIAIFIAIIITLVRNEIMSVWMLYVSMLVGMIIGYIIAIKVKMIAMPQIIAMLNGFGGLASTIVGGFALVGVGVIKKSVIIDVTSFLALTIGMITFVGSLIAALKLSKRISQKAITYKGHRFYLAFTLLLLVALLFLLVFKVLDNRIIILLSLIIASLFGYLFSIRIGGADMPITISLLNSLSGVAASIAGIAINDILLVAIGGIVGASGLLLTQIMCKSMNRKLISILLGKTTTKALIKEEKHEIIENKEDPLIMLKEAKKVIIVPGYGMAIAQAQHLVKELADKLKENGATVKYAIHPVAGRMPGHMNVLLAEADVDYDDLFAIEDINEEFASADLALVIGANDIINPSARELEGTPIYGMPILNVDQAKKVLIFNYDLNPGYSGVENKLYYLEKVKVVLGNASETLKKIIEGM